MSETAAITVLGVATFQSLIIVIGNSFTILVFWIHRNRLKRTSLLLINLAVADLFVGFTQILVVGAYALPRQTGVFRMSETRLPRLKYIATLFQAAFSSTSVFFHLLISLERALALIWPLRHRVATTKAYNYSIAIVWAAGKTGAAMSFLFFDGLLDLRYYLIVF